MAGLRAYTGYDPDVVARNLFRLGNTVSETVNQGNRHKLDMANLGLTRAKQDYDQANRKQVLDTQLAQAGYDKKMAEVIDAPTFFKENGIDPAKYSKEFESAGIDIGSVTFPRAKGYEIMNSLNKEARDVQRDEKNFGRVTPKDQAYIDYMKSEAEKNKRTQVTAAQEKEQNRVLEGWKQSMIDTDLKAANLVADGKGNYAKVGPPDFEGKPTLIPANDEAAQVLLRGRLYDNAISLAKTDGTTPDVALNKIVTKYKEQQAEAIRKKQLGSMGKPDVAGLSAAIAARNQVNKYGKRPDGTQKGPGFLGELKRPDGDISTELSIGVGFDGKETLIPLIVPTLSGPEIDTLLNLKKGEKPPKEIVDKAIDHAKSRMSKGLSPFAGWSERQGNDLEPKDVHPITQIINNAYGGIGRWNANREKAAERIRNIQ